MMSLLFQAKIAVTSLAAKSVAPDRSE